MQTNQVNSVLMCKCCVLNRVTGMVTGADTFALTPRDIPKVSLARDYPMAAQPSPGAGGFCGAVWGCVGLCGQGGWRMKSRHLPALRGTGGAARAGARSLHKRSAAATSCPLAVVLPRRQGTPCDLGEGNILILNSSPSQS